jgi:competence protein ComEA
VAELSRSQVLVYGAVAIALLLLGARAIRAEEPASGLSSVPGGGSLSFDTREGDDVVVHVAGAVRSPGVYRLPSGSRVDDAVRRAGGARSGGMVDAVNLAARLTDGQQVVVPSAGDATATGAVAEGPVSLGTASAEQLDAVDGIGPVTAEAIIEFRDEHGGLASIEQLDQISGIGPATMESLRAGLQP